MYLIKFDYYKYEGAYEWQSEQRLVLGCVSFEEACEKIKSVHRFASAMQFVNMTIE